MNTEMTTTNPTTIEQAVTTYMAMSTNDLQTVFNRCLSSIAENIVHMAAIVRVLEGRGQDLTNVKNGMLPLLRRIGCGQVLPEIVSQFNGFPKLLRKAQALPLADQRALLGGTPIPVAFVTDKGTTHRVIAPLSMSPGEVDQVLANDHIRDIGEQVSYIAAKARPAATATAEVVVGKGGIYVTPGQERVFISVKEMANFIVRAS